MLSNMWLFALDVSELFFFYNDLVKVKINTRRNKITATLEGRPSTLYNMMNVYFLTEQEKDSILHMHFIKKTKGS